MGTWIVGAVVFGIIALTIYKVFVGDKKGAGCCGCSGRNGCGEYNGHSEASNGKKNH